MTFKFSQVSLKRMEGVNPKLVAVAQTALAISPIDFGIPEFGGLRTAAEQHSLFTRGLSKCDGYDRKSNHQGGEALDFFAIVDGKASWEPGAMAIVATAFYASAMQHRVMIRWGGHFTPHKKFGNLVAGWDMAHVELVE